jgi:hypothetical protein
MKLKNTEKLRNLEEVCKNNGFCFQINLCGINYCKLSMNGRKNKRIECSYLGEKDHNKIRTCNVIIVENNSSYLS